MVEYARGPVWLKTSTHPTAPAVKLYVPHLHFYNLGCFQLKREWNLVKQLFLWCKGTITFYSSFSWVAASLMLTEFALSPKRADPAPNSAQKAETLSDCRSSQLHNHPMLGVKYHIYWPSADLKAKATYPLQDTICPSLDPNALLAQTPSIAWLWNPSVLQLHEHEANTQPSTYNTGHPFAFFPLFSINREQKFLFVKEGRIKQLKCSFTSAETIDFMLVTTK